MSDAGKRRAAPRRPTAPGLAPALKDPRRPLARGDGVWVYFDHQEPNYWPEHQHDCVQITLVFDGANSEVAWRGHDGRRILRRVHPGEVLILPPSISQELRWREEADLIILFVEKETARELAGFTLDSPSIRPLGDYLNREPAVGLLCDALRAEPAQSQGPQHRHTGVLGTALASLILRAHFAPERAETKKGPSRLRREDRTRVEQYVADHLSEAFSLTAVARAARMSRSHFCRTFKAETGLTPREYFNRCRVLRAKELIATGRYTLTQVMHELGFSELGHFTRVFRKYLHVPPRWFLPANERQ